MDDLDKILAEEAAELNKVETGLPKQVQQPVYQSNHQRRQHESNDAETMRLITGLAILMGGVVVGIKLFSWGMNFSF